MAVCGVGDVLMMFIGHMGWGICKNIKRVGRSFLITLVLRLVMTLGLDFGMLCWCGD
jgi:hypothetical protein